MFFFYVAFPLFFLIFLPSCVVALVLDYKHYFIIYWASILQNHTIKWEVKRLHKKKKVNKTKTYLLLITFSNICVINTQGFEGY
jgi:hypothetical protein